MMLRMKRFFDLICSVVALIFLFPLFLIIAGIIRATIGSPIFFRQQRPGIRGRPFDMVKFRTMANTRNKNGELLGDVERMTDIGRFLRKTSLDELPELWNVLKGEMSLVGPRPLLMEYLPLYTPEQARRHEVKPGITGWAQVNGRNAISWEEKFKLDVWYVDHSSFWLDIKILGLTGLKVFKGEGVSQKGHVTAEKFRGSAE
ncbi:MAG TPA: sugar transferase [Nitrospiria bacterium]|nr:sugar transferase [Candidatus Manganitrophaceae bacterium]